MPLRRRLLGDLSAKLASSPHRICASSYSFDSHPHNTDRIEMDADW